LSKLHLGGTSNSNQSAKDIAKAFLKDLLHQIPTSTISSPIAAILLEMRRNEQNGRKQNEGLLELQSLAVNDDKNRVTIVEEGGINVILSAMRTHSSNSGLQEYSCGTLVMLAENDYNKVVIAAEGGIPMILSAMKHHFSSANLLYYGCKALSNLAVNNDQNRVTIVEAGGINVILSAMRTHSSNADLQEYGCATLEQLVVNNDNNKVMSAEACLEISVKRLKENDPHLFKLSLSDKSFGVDCAKAIAETFNVNTVLTVLDLSKNSLAFLVPRPLQRPSRSILP